MVLEQKNVLSPFRLPKRSFRRWKCLRVLFTSEGQREHNIDRWINVLLGVEDGAKPKGKTLDYRLIYMPPLTNGYGLWVMTEMTRSHKPAAKMSFLSRVDGGTLKDKGRTSVARE